MNQTTQTMRWRRLRPPDNWRVGLTLAECTIALTILSLTVAGVSQLVVAGQQAGYDGLKNVRAQTLVDALMEEIVSKPYTAPASPGSKTRANYTGTGDYIALSEAAGAVKDFSGIAIAAEYQSFSRTATVTATTRTLASGVSQPVSGELVVVTVKDSGHRAWIVSRFIPAP